MTVEGWDILRDVEYLDYSTTVPNEMVTNACQQLDFLNRGLMNEVVSHLKSAGEGRLASYLSGEFRASDKKLFDYYLHQEAYSFMISQLPKAMVDEGGDASQQGKKAAVVFYLAFVLQADLNSYLSALPSATVPNAKKNPNETAFTMTHIHRELDRVVCAMKSVQSELESYAFRCEDLLVGTDGTRFFGSATTWPLDAELMQEAILLGILRTGTPSTVNSEMLASPVVAAGAIRSHLESVLFMVDFRSRMEQATQINVETWEEALQEHINHGRLASDQTGWTRKTYGLLSSVLHRGFLLTRGEVHLLIRIVGNVAAKLRESTSGHMNQGGEQPGAV